MVGGVAAGMKCSWASLSLLDRSQSAIVTLQAVSADHVAVIENSWRRAIRPRTLEA
jgi:hypothetical protein